jgi:hypothetical protein
MSTFASCSVENALPPKSHGRLSCRVARYRFMARSSSPSTGCSVDNDPLSRSTQRRDVLSFRSCRRIFSEQGTMLTRQAVAYLVRQAGERAGP